MNTWIFQGNPKHFDMDTYLTENEHITWSVRQKYLADQMQVGDIVFIWRSDGGKKGTGGMIAKSKVTKAPYNVVTQLNHAEHWKEDMAIADFPSIDLQVLEVDLTPRMTREKLRSVASLEQLLILRMSQHTNYLIAPAHAEVIAKLWHGPSAEDDLQAMEIEAGRLEGKLQTYYGQRYERDAVNRQRAIDIHGTTCTVCGFDFEKVYGARGRNYIEVHHIKPLHQTKETIVNPATDLVPLCANCHRMIHRDPHNVLTPDELKQLLQDMKETY